MNALIRRRVWLGWTAILCGVGFTLWGLRTSFAEQDSLYDRSSRGGTKPSAGSSHGEVPLEETLDRILANQEIMLQKFDAVMEELRIIKVRSSLRSGS